MRTIQSKAKGLAIRNVRRGIVSCFLVSATVLGLLAVYVPSSQSQGGTRSPTGPTRTLKIEAEHLSFTVRYPNGWSAPPPVDTYQLLNVPAEQQATLDVATLNKTARIIITMEHRIDHAEAVRRLREIAAEVDSPSTFLKIGGWPALQRRYLAAKPQPLPGPGQGAPLGRSTEMELNITTAVAAGDFLVRLDGRLLPDAPPKIAEEIKAIGQSLVFPSTGNPGQVDQEIKNLRSSPSLRPSPSTPLPQEGGSSASAAPGATPLLHAQASSTQAAPESPVPVGAGSELSVGVSTDGQNVVIGANGAYYFSTDGGQTWQSATGLTAANDPQVAVGQSGIFYAANISGNSTSIDVAPVPLPLPPAQTFTFRANAFTCPGSPPSCGGFSFPDQEQIAADRVNAAPGGDRVYSAWRNGGSTYGIVCSANSGATWSGTVPASFTAGDFPRINVGPDGFVYVVYLSGGNIMLNKYNACNGNAMTSLGGVFPVMVATGISLACPIPGLDRCPTGSLHMVAVDDTNSHHVYVAYVSTTAGNENIVVQDSVNDGSNWSTNPNDHRIATVNTAVPTRRFMPWICAVGGAARVSWYDRRAATPCPSPPCAANNDLTDYFAGSASLDAGGNLVAGTEFQINTAGSADAQCAAGATPGSAASWPCGVRAMADSESCSVQPQQAGRCQITTSPPCPPMGAPCGTFTPCDFDQGPACLTFMGNAQICGTRRGCPKYGDYNGNACAAGRLFAAWASATPAVAGSPGINIFFAVEPPFSSDLSITKVDSPDPVTVGNNLTYTVTVTNNGPDTAYTVTVTDNLPAETTFVSCSSTGGGVCSGLGNNRTVTFASLTAGESETITFVATVNCSVADGTVISNTATVSASTPDPDATNNSATATTTAFNPPPTITGVSVDKPVLWPPNHKLVDVTVDYNVTDNCPLPPNSCTLSVTSNEPINGTGDGDTSPDWIILDAHHVQLRAERSGKGNGRIYTSTITCTDSGGSSSSQTVAVSVPHDKGRK